MKPIEIAFATYNRLDLTKQTIKSLFENTNTYFNLTIIDNASSDGTQNWLSENVKENDFCKKITLIFNKTNKGIAYARNQGLLSGMKSDPDYYFVLDNDIELHFDWLNECVEIMSKNPEYCVGINMENNQYPLEILNGCEFQVKHQGNLGSACAGFPSSLVKKIGFFKSYNGTLYSCEDSNFFFRARKAGYKMGYLKTMGIHLGENETGDYRDWKTKCHNEIAPIFISDCYNIMSGKSPLYLDFKEDDV